MSVHVKERGVIQATALGKNCSSSLFVCVLIALYLFPDVDDVASLRIKAASINVVQVGELGSQNSLCSLNYPGQISLILCSAAGIPHCNTMAENAFYCAPVKIH